MSLLVTGSIGIDTIETPKATAENVLGGSATYFSVAASFFCGVKLVAVAGEDFPPEHLSLLAGGNIDTAGLEIRQGSKTFRWRGKYSPDMNDRQTLEVHLNVLGEPPATVPDQFRDCPYVFLANDSPVNQLAVLKSMSQPKLSVADTMDLWIETQHDQLLELMKHVDGLVINDQEAKMLADNDNLIRAGRAVQAMGPKFVIVKKGEHGAMYFSPTETFILPAFPTVEVQDPTGAGDSFAGGMMGYAASTGAESGEKLKRAIAYGTIVASFAVEDFSLSRLKEISRTDIDKRFTKYQNMISLG